MATHMYQANKPNTAKNILYLLLSFPLGVFYFVFLVVGLSVGVSTIIVWIGIPILFATFVGIAGMAAMERSIAARMLHVALPPVPRRYAQTWKERFNLRFCDPLTWKSLLYLLIKFPLGIISFSLALPLILTSVTLLLGPLEYVIATQILQGLGIHLTNQLPATAQLVTVQVTGDFNVIEFAKSFILTLVGLVFWQFTRYLLNGLAWINGQLVRTLLTSPSHSAMPKYEQYNYQEIKAQQQSAPYPNL